MGKLLWVLVLIPGIALASGGRDVEQQVDVAGDSYIEGSSTALGFAHSLGDVDINQCLGSTQWGTILVSKQKLVLNKWCAAEVYDAKGLHKMAALLRCDIPEIQALIPDHLECMAANTAFLAPSAAPIDTEHLEEEEDWHQEQLQMQQDYDERIERLEARLSRPTTKRVVEQKPLLTEDQKARLEEVLKK